MYIYNEIKNGNISIEKVGKGQEQCKSKLNQITIGNRKNKLKTPLDTIKNIKNLYNSREEVVKLYNDYAKIISIATHKTKQRTGLKILTPKKMLQGLPIALLQVKAVMIKKIY